MFKVSIEKLINRTGGQYTLLEMAFQRTHQLNAGMHPTIKTSSKKNATIALQEIAAGTVREVREGEEPVIEEDDPEADDEE
jgi:DNA-directed RNA polymerase omega subunit